MEEDMMEQPQLGKNYMGFKDLTHTNMCYRCDYCDQPYQNIYWLHQIAIEYYKLTLEGLRELRYVENRTEWQDAGKFPSKPFFPYPLGFDT